MSIIMRTTMRKARFMPSVVIVNIHQSHEHLAARGVEKVEDAGEDDDEDEGLEALQERPWLYLREGDAADRDGKHQSVGQPVHGREEGGDVDDDEQQLGARVEPVDDGVARGSTGRG